MQHNKMASATFVVEDVSAQLPNDVYQEQFDFTELIRDVVDSVDSQTPDSTVQAQVQLLLALVGRDLLKLHALINVVNAKIVSQSSWATVGVKLYRALFDTIDPDLELEVVNGKSIVGADIAGKYILEAAGEFIARPIWEPGSVNVLDFSLSLLRAFSVGQRGSAIAVNVGCGLLEKMATSLYLPFHNNYDTFFPFAYKAIPLLDTADENMKSSRVTDILMALKKENYERTEQEKALIKHMCDILGRSDLYQQHTESGYTCTWEDTDSDAAEDTVSAKVEYVYGRGRFSVIPPEELDQAVETSSKLCTTTQDWELPAIERLLKSISEAMKIGAPTWVQTITLDMIEIMVKSDYVFLHKNMQILVGFMFPVAPALDAMADNHHCERLTTLFDALSTHNGVQTVQDHDTIEDIRRKLGRGVHSAATQPIGDMLEEDDLLGAISKLEID
ncbi:uncharacterized protein J4E92_008227 [Alternaria infectoria]|uniref:uncharacterized protein n=1 Tax=Alternaria infectoria TaxID=45303 RepID=UPI00222010C8|nr:uncharacterized protein J4E92_008227 [Alternaria infectoria]KAI4921238.1 hypothetical protein J4E92_008227 [Alternaria infectoria]